MTKKELLADVMANMEFGATKALVSDAIDSTFRAITDHIKTGEKVSIKGFGTFSAYTRAPYETRDPRTGDRVKVAESRRVKFKASEKFFE